MRKTLFGALSRDKVHVHSSSGRPYDMVLQTDSAGKRMLIHEQPIPQPDWDSTRIRSQIAAGLELKDCSTFRVQKSLEQTTADLVNAGMQVEQAISVANQPVQSEVKQETIESKSE